MILAGYAIVLLSIILFAIYFDLFSIKRLNVVSVLLASHIIIQFAPASQFVFAGDYASAEVFLLAAALATLLIPLGALFADTVVPHARLAVPQFYRKQSTPGPKDINRLRVLYRSLVVVSGAITAVYIILVPSWPLLDLVLSSDASHASFMEARRAASTAASIYPFAVIKLFLLPFLVSVSIAWLMMESWRPHVTRPTMIVALLIAILFCSYSGATTGVATIVAIGVLTGWHCLVMRVFNGQSKYSLLRFAVVGILLILSYPVIIALFKPIGDLGIAYILEEEILARITTKPALNAYYAFEVFPAIEPFTWFTDIGDIAILTGKEFVNTGQVISIYKGQGPFNQAPPPTLGTFYAQGGWYVVIGGYLLVGTIFRSIENLLTHSRKKGPVEVALHSVLLFGAFRVAWSKFHYVLLTETILPSILIIGVWAFVRNASFSSPQRT